MNAEDAGELYDDDDLVQYYELLEEYQDNLIIYETTLQSHEDDYQTFTYLYNIF